MADITRASVSVDTSTGQFASQVPDLVAGEALVAGDAVYIKSDGKVWKSTGAASNAASAFAGMVAKAYAVGRAVTIYGAGTRFRYATGMTPGARLFISGATAGALADAASTGGTAVVARAVTATDIIIISLASGAF